MNISASLEQVKGVGEKTGEQFKLAGLRTVELITRFLPYSTKSRLPSHPLLVRAYLRFPPMWRLIGRQTLYVAEAAR